MFCSVAARKAPSCAPSTPPPLLIHLQTCQRYWTAGGTLRDVPPGSGRRKSKSAAAAAKAQKEGGGDSQAPPAAGSSGAAAGMVPPLGGGPVGIVPPLGGLNGLPPLGGPGGMMPPLGGTGLPGGLAFPLDPMAPYGMPSVSGRCLRWQQGWQVEAWLFGPLGPARLRDLCASAHAQRLANRFPIKHSRFLLFHPFGRSGACCP